MSTDALLFAWTYIGLFITLVEWGYSISRLQGATRWRRILVAPFAAAIWPILFIVALAMLLVQSRHSLLGKGPRQ